MSSPTELYLPTTLPYPIKLVSLAVAPDADIQRGSRLLEYSYTYLDPDARPQLRFGTWDSSLEGTFSRWAFNKDDIISAQRAREHPAAYILEPCKHGVQLGGLCCLCGKDMTRFVLTPRPPAACAAPNRPVKNLIQNVKTVNPCFMRAAAPVRFDPPSPRWSWTHARIRLD